MSNPNPLYCRDDSKERGRHLKACQDISKGQLIFCERPLLSLQSLGENVACAWVCHLCKSFVGGPDIALERRFTENPEELIRKAAERQNVSEAHTIVSCRRDCGQVFCSKECEEDAWLAHHSLLCTGICSEDDPLVQYKRLAAESNEILIMVAEWWVMEHTIPDRQPFTDFCMNPWWDVATAELKQLPGGFSDAVALEKSLRKLCEDAADLLNQALPESIPRIDPLDIARRVGACEQNAMGIRQRHALCRDVFDRDFRERKHADIVRCLEEAGFIGEGKVEEEDQCSIEASGETQKVKEPEQTEEWNYSVEEIADFLSNIFIDEDGSVRDEADPLSQERDSQGDDLDYIFPPFDGTTMYATICKMNHSCDANVIVMYKRRGWGRKHPLTAYCIARKDIKKEDELTISYIEDDQPFEARQSALVNYGFTCQCSKCSREQSAMRNTVDAESSKVNDTAEINEDDLFGGDDEEENDDEEKEETGHSTSDAETKLQSRLERLESAGNHTRHGSIPLTLVARISSFVVQSVAVTIPVMNDAVVVQLLEQCVEGLTGRDFALLKTVGCDLELVLYSTLQRNGSWPSTCYREAYWCSVLVAALAFANECSFLEALFLMDKATVLGLPRDDIQVREFFAYTEWNASEMAKGPHVIHKIPWMEDYRDEQLHAVVERECLPRGVQFPIETLEVVPTAGLFQERFVKTRKPVCIKGYALGWPAISSWRDPDTFVHRHGHRVVPVEVGSMLEGSMKESLMTLRQFFIDHLSLSNRRSRWSLDDALRSTAEISYLAQHPLLRQIPLLENSIEVDSTLCGPGGPSHIYTWIGSGGTRTPLHFDSYPNLFVQVAGCKYIRLYGQEQSPNLYPGSSSAYGSQGNMSDVDVENEDYEKHPKIKLASYTEIVLYPGDCLFIPALTWHYVRSLSTSASVNFWF